MLDHHIQRRNQIFENEEAMQKSNIWFWEQSPPAESPGAVIETSVDALTLNVAVVFVPLQLIALQFVQVQYNTMTSSNKRACSNRFVNVTIVSRK